ncbi:MAG: adenylyltransferase/cytidyltransferase family protein [Candidatus Paceibacterota bacterium]|jgi:rfaE bifunctional protein nucleotidyltransferase chain/domain
MSVSKTKILKKKTVNRGKVAPQKMMKQISHGGMYCMVHPAIQHLGLHSNFPKRFVKSYKEIAKIAQECRKNGLKVVLTQGSYDMVHIGHARYLEAAKKKGDILIVGLDSDKKIKHRKGPERPIVPEDERLEMLTHLRSVDMVFLKDLGDPKWHLIKTIKPDALVVIQENYNDEEIKMLQEHCREVCVFDRQATTSTSAKLRLMQIGIASKLSQKLTPKIVEVIESVFNEIKK